MWIHVLWVCEGDKFEFIATGALPQLADKHLFCRPPLSRNGHKKTGDGMLADERAFCNVSSPDCGQIRNCGGARIVSTTG